MTARFRRAILLGRVTRYIAGTFAVPTLLSACVHPTTPSEPAPRAAAAPAASPAAETDGRSFVRPVSGRIIGTFDGRSNKGLDFAGRGGDPVIAAGDGSVLYAGAGPRGQGQLLVLRHDNRYLTAYVHNGESLVKPGDAVRQGQTIARMGQGDAERVKLHFEVRRNGISVDPVPYFAAAGAGAAAARPAEKDERRSGPASGSGFAVTDKYLVTNAHVVSNCKRIAIDERGAGRVRALDRANDLALVETGSSPAVARLRDGRVRQGETVTVIGFPYAGMLGDGPHVTVGTVTALAGMRNDTRVTQISAAIQPGSSGGPVVDQSGNVVGVVVGRLGLRSTAATADLPQNLNFAISLDTLRGFLHAHGVMYQAAPLGPVLSTPDVADIARPFTVLVRCLN